MSSFCLTRQQARSNTEENSSQNRGESDAPTFGKIRHLQLPRVRGTDVGRIIHFLKGKCLRLESTLKYFACNEEESCTIAREKENARETKYTHTYSVLHFGCNFGNHSLN